MLRRYLSGLMAVFMMVLSGLVMAQANPGGREVAVFAGGCFWSMQKAFDDVPGVLATRAGFMGGHVRHPEYEEVVTETTGHVEAVEVTFDPSKISYEALVSHYWHNIDPFTLEGQFCDFASSYHSAIFTFGEAQYKAATASKATITTEMHRQVVTLIRKSEAEKLPFYPASNFHQHYAKFHAEDYADYARRCGRHEALILLWGGKAFK